MSGTSYDAICPECEKETLMCNSDWKPYDVVSGTCVHCGFCYYTKETQLTKKELKEIQAEYCYDSKTEKFNP